jgi:small-conductance mechanosensitive channel
METTAAQETGATTSKGELLAPDAGSWAAMRPAALLDGLQDWLVAFGPRFLGAVLVLIVGCLFAWALRGVLYRLLAQRTHLSMDVRFFVPQFVYLGGLTLTFVLTLAAMGVAGSVVGVLVSVGIAVGVFSDLFYGAQLLTLRPFQIGDVIELQESGLTGVVTRISIALTRLETSAGTEVVLPTRRLYAQPIINHTVHFEKTVQLRFVVAPGTDINRVRQTIAELMASDRRVQERSRAVNVTEVAQEGVTIKVSFRTRFDAADEVSGELLVAALTRFADSGIGIISIMRET